ncbi:right-handed parallel beta-helix repeat-containing protein [Methanohalophilus halophilus]|uniref:PGF-pre-PGF domain-containing protein n=1 Tax=Methanohalophilus halophilus TaxID=2177 RepID=A0A1L3Q102_9EURY|nr:right-handed parallel beta-helix repeat-containing protein [Methanohalophilus halophilus]APH38540.1 hypothetical protein BHR79_02900 [Methanohalophilus halophilus]RNI08466.1 PGF-pre-PGF domain-containing protein [Methanohalophilus halophilus]SDW13261.1 PGF-pre-PGF domain-containing protein [Methanohalophilus halophilus]
MIEEGAPMLKIEKLSRKQTILKLSIMFILLFTIITLLSGITYALPNYEIDSYPDDYTPNPQEILLINDTGTIKGLWMGNSSGVFYYNNTTSSWYKEIDGGLKTIAVQRAIDNSTTNENTIIVGEGAYDGTLNIDIDDLELKIHGNRPTIDGLNSFYTIQISSDNATLEGFRITGADSNGIYLRGINNTIKNNTVQYNGQGIALSTSSNNSIINNAVQYNSWHGIAITGSCNNNFIANNTVQYNSFFGIWILSRNNLLENNTVCYNEDDGVYIASTNNTLNKNDIYSNKGHGTNIHTSSDAHVGSNNTLINNNMHNNTYSGISIGKYYQATVGSTNNTLINNNIHNNTQYGIIVGEDCSNNSIKNNAIRNNTDYGIRFFGSNNLLKNNEFTEDGLFLESFDNIIADNTVNNKPLVYLKNVTGEFVDKAGQVILLKCNNITFKDMKIENTDTGVYLHQTNDTRFYNCTIRDNSYEGIHLRGQDNILKNVTIVEHGSSGIEILGDNNTVIDSTIRDNGRFGIDTRGLNNILNNVVVQNNAADGIALSGRSNIINDSTIRDNGRYGIDIDGLNNTLNNSIIQNNTENAVYFRGDSNILVNNIIQYNKANGISYSGSNNVMKMNTVRHNREYGICPNRYSYPNSFNELKHNTVQNNSNGIYFNDNRGVLHNNTIEDNTLNGVILSGSDNEVSHNTIENNTDSGIKIYSSFGSTLESNTIVTNSIGINLIKSASNIFYQNTIANNTQRNIQSMGPPNYWTSPDNITYSYEGKEYTSKLGNYYGDYDGNDTDGDGIGDTLNYTIDSGNIDTRPLVLQWEEITKSSSTSDTFAETTEQDSNGRTSVGPSIPPEAVDITNSNIKSVTGGSNVKYDFSDSEGPVMGISFDAKDNEGNVVAKVQVLKEKPDDVDEPSGKSYRVLSMSVGSEGTINEDNADNILIDFKVSWNWIKENDIDPATIHMARFHDGQWQDLPSNKVGEDDKFLHFVADTPGFSLFSIIGDEREAIEEVIPEEREVEEVADEPASEEESAKTPGFTALFAVAIIAGAALLTRQKSNR